MREPISTSPHKPPRKVSNNKYFSQVNDFYRIELFVAFFGHIFDAPIHSRKYPLIQEVFGNNLLTWWPPLVQICVCYKEFVNIPKQKQKAPHLVFVFLLRY